MHAHEARKLADLVNDEGRTPFQDALAGVLYLIRRRAENGHYGLILTADMKAFRDPVLRALGDLGYQVVRHRPAAGPFAVGQDEVSWR